MNLTTHPHPHRSDVLTLTKGDLQQIADGVELQVSALKIKLERKPDVVMCRTVGIYHMPSEADPNGLLSVGVFGAPNVRFVFDGETRELKHVELIK